MRYVSDWVIHTSATRSSADIGAKEIREWHMNPPLNWSDIGYHEVIRRNGMLEPGRELWKEPACVRGVNSHIICTCLVGGLNDETGEAENNYTDEQWITLEKRFYFYRKKFPWIGVRGHRDYSPDLNGNNLFERHEWFKECPCFDVADWVRDLAR